MVASTKSSLGHRAVVLGASMAGLMAARVLAEFFDDVAVVERDVLSDEPDTRKGVPQGKHVHALLGRGSRVLGELFPGLLQELVADGAPVWDDGDLSKLYMDMGGHTLIRSGFLRDPHTMTIYMPSRPMLESHVRRRLRALRNVVILDGHDVADLMITHDGTRVTGAHVVNRAGGVQRTLTADLVVDATGRGSRTPAFLESHGYGRPDEDQVVVRVAYASQRLRIPAGRLTQKMVLCGACPERPSGVGLIGYEHDTWILTVGGLVGYEPPLDRAGMLRFVQDLIPPDVVAALREATPLGDVAGYRVPSNRWWRYDKMRRLPEGLLVTGDAICSFNPLYGQGMTVAALDAQVLRRCLLHGLDELPRRFFGASAKSIGLAWQMATGSDLSMPGVQERMPRIMRMTNAYTDRVLRAAESDLLVCEKFLRTMQLIDPPVRLLAPGVVAKAVAARSHRRPVGSPVVTSEHLVTQ